MYSAAPTLLEKLEDTMRMPLLKVKVFAVFTLVFAGLLPCRADTIIGSDSILIIPDGSQITGTFVLPPGSFNVGPTPGINFKFADGTGTTEGEFNDGDQGIINFIAPLTSLTINWVAVGIPYEFWDSDNLLFECEMLTGCPTSGTFTFTGTDITSLSWANSNGWSGVESMTYTTPEPGIFWMLLTALLLLGLPPRAQMSLRKLSER